MRFFSTLRKRLTDRLIAAHTAAPRTTKDVLASAAVLALLVVVGSAWYLTHLVRTLPDQAAIGRMGEMDQATTVYDEDDRLAFTIFKEQRIDVPLSQISPNLVRALVAVEDQRFYDHHGFDLVR